MKVLSLKVSESLDRKLSAVVKRRHMSKSVVVREALEQYLDESLAVADRQGARFEHAQTLLARGQVGQQHGWADAQHDLTTAREALCALGADFVLDDAGASAVIRAKPV